MLRRSANTINPIGKTHPIKLPRLIAMQTFFGDENIHHVICGSKFGLNGKERRIAKRVAVLCPKMGDFPRQMIFYGFWQKIEVMAEAGIETCRFHVSCIDEQFNAIPSAHIRKH